MKTLFVIFFSLIVSGFTCGDAVETLYPDCSTPGKVWCESTDKFYCSMDNEIIKVCDTVTDCETDCVNLLI